MIGNILIGGAIFGYAGYAFVRFIKKAKKGKCAACDVRESCHNPCGKEDYMS
jgi:radical SAM protein with 4Fe4S-binding SPASM domain